jgi:multicomponent Na+:H+ antiporter subunit B
MKTVSHVVLSAAARFYVPLILLFAAVLLLTKTAGAGVGFCAGLAFALALLLHALVFGLEAARAALPPMLTRLVVAAGAVATFVGVALPGLPFASQLAEAGLFAVTAAGSGLLFLVLIGRAPTMRDEEWG